MFKVCSRCFEPVLVRHGEHHNLHQLLDLLVQSTNVAVLLSGPGVHLYGLHPAVILGWQGVQDQVAVLIYSNQIPLLEFLWLHQPSHWQEGGRRVVVLFKFNTLP